MLFRVFSSLLAENTKWYALNDRLCGKEPRKFRENSVFYLFTDEIRRLKFEDLRDENGRHVLPEWFGRGSWRGSEYVYVGTSFPVLAGNLARRNPPEVEYFRSKEFLSLKCAINRVEFRVDVLDRSSEDQAVDAKDQDSSKSRPSIDEEETSSVQTKDLDGSCCPPSTGSPPRTNSAPKCSTPTTGSPPQFVVPGDSPTSSLDDTSKSGSSISDIANASYVPATKRKIRQKVETVMSDVENLCKGRGESLGDLITQSCLFQSIKKFDGKKIVSQVFSEVAKELGVREAFDKLVPDELWDKRVEMMSVPDWMLLLCKLESKISDDGWQMLLNRSTLGKSGVSCRGLINLIIGGGGSGGQDPARVGGSRVTGGRRGKGRKGGKLENIFQHIPDY